MPAPLAFAALEPGAAVAGHARVGAAEAAQTRAGAPFWRLRLADPTGVCLAARRFDCPGPPPDVGTVVNLAGVVDAYRGTVGLRLTACAADPAVPAAAFWPRTPPERAATAADLAALVAGIADPALRALVDACLPPRDRVRFLVAPAAVRHHGATVGGLLAHSVGVARLALALADRAPGRVDRGVLVAAALLHDLGKLAELGPEPGTGVTDAGRLFGHVLLGAARVGRAAETVPGLDPARAGAVLHAVVAAHGRPEWGAPVRPCTVEAVLVHLADAAEATLVAALEAVERAPAGAAWTGYAERFGAALRVPPAPPGG